MTRFDHPIFVESMSFIRRELGSTGLASYEQQVLERLIHSSGDFHLKTLLRFSPDACQVAISALLAGAPILTDTEMALAAVKPMAKRTLNTQVQSVLEWAPTEVDKASTRTAIGIESGRERNLRDRPEGIKGLNAPRCRM